MRLQGQSRLQLLATTQGIQVAPDAEASYQVQPVAKLLLKDK